MSESKNTLPDEELRKIKTPFEELHESFVESNLVKLCISAITGQAIKISNLPSVSNDVKTVIRLSAKDENLGRVTKFENCPVKYKEIIHSFRAYSKFKFSISGSIKYSQVYTVCEPYLYDRYACGSKDCKGPRLRFKRNCLDCIISKPHSEFDMNLETIFRTILPAHNDYIKFENVRMTPVTIILPTGFPKTNKRKSETSWQHVVVGPNNISKNFSYIEKISITNRLLLIFQAIRLTSLKTGRSTDQKVFSEIMSKHPILKETLALKSTETSAKEIDFDELFLKKAKIKESYDSQTKLLDIFGWHDVPFKSIRIEAARANDLEATFRDTDVLSTGIASLMTNSNVTAITFYIESDADEMYTRPYIIAPKNIINMLLDLRTYGNNYQKEFALNSHNGIGLDNTFNKMVRDVRANVRVDLQEKEIERLKLQRDEILREKDKRYLEKHSKQSLYKDIPTKKSMRKVNRVKPYRNYGSEATETTSDIVKLTDMRTSLGFALCRIEQHNFDDQGVNFSKLAEERQTKMPLIVNFPVPYRYDPDKETDFRLKWD